METTNIILNLMIGHHALIEVYFSILKDKLSSQQNVSEDLEKFKWQIEKHFFVEEKVVFDYDHFRIKNEKVYQLVKELTNEHVIIIREVERFSKQITDNEKPDMSGFQKLLEDHRKTEENELYPILDKELDESKKEEIVKRVNDIILEKK